ncbi:MAG TPA: hypothetical protein VIJ85_03510 [Rhizomicrobium sp.]
MGQRVKPEELREMLKVARKLRLSARGTDEVSYTDLFMRAAAALEERASELAFQPADLILDDDDDENVPGSSAPDLYRHVDFRC